MSRKEIIAKKLSVLKPEYLKIINDSPDHAYHEASPGSGESHFTVKIKASSLGSKTLIEQHRVINNLLKEEFENGLHALSIIVDPVTD